MNRKNKILLFGLLFILLRISIFANDGVDSSASSEDETIIIENQVEMNFKTKSSIGALARSFAVPGWGQLYVESYWKAPIFFGGAATLYYLIIKNHNEYSDYNRQYNGLIDKTTFEATTLKNKRESALDNRDMAAFYLLGVYALGAVDAFVGSHLFDFNVDDEFLIYLSSRNRGYQINFQYKLK